MPIYEYEHLAFNELEEICLWGEIFDIKQSIHDDPFTVCPNCKNPVRKRISAVGLSLPKTNKEIRDMGFTKLVKRDDGVYENVTRREGESRYMERGQPDTTPDLSKIIRD